MGNAARRINREVHADVGYAHLDIPRLELVVWPWGRQPGSSNGDGSVCSSGGGGSAAAGTAAAAAAGSTEVAAGGAGEGAGAAAPLAAADSTAAGQQQEHLPDYLRGEAPAAAGAGSSRAKVGRGGGSRQASLQQLNSHMACLSGRWWETFGSGGGRARRG